MHITLAVIGKAKSNALSTQLFDEYIKRLPWTITVSELEEKKPLPNELRKQREADLLLGACTDTHRIIALDERGKDITSIQLAQKIGDWQQNGDSKFTFIIGGQDGLHPSIRQRADLVLSFGKLTWPHMLVRPLLAEQLYRVYTILTNHPYHRD
ncbi:MAG: 23S rRNA (pseudouridine(1915)-N(3))-methyltransferase RlmH [Alphaproteobacteria bacterium]|nr:23S rRNA (pseudouridine(1915)-N(3))-methyltransferase RlmH [Alphaproteobacteria bacterium]